MNANVSRHIAVIGAGISGLTTAFWLARHGHTVTIIEERSRVGGTIESERENGFLIELGPNSALDTTPLIGRLTEQLGIGDQLVYANDAAQNRFIVRNGALQPVPLSPGSFITSPLFSARAKLRLLKEPFIAPGRDREETIAAFVERRLGREFLDYAINPFVAGVYAGDPRTLSVAEAFPKLHQLEQRFGSILRGAIAGKKDRKRRERRGEVSKQSAKMFSFRDGLSTLTDAMGAHLGGRILLKCTVDSIGPSPGGGYTVAYSSAGCAAALNADGVVISVPAKAAADLIAPHDSELAEALTAVIYPPVSMVYLGYPVDSIERKLDGFGFLVPEVEKRSILGTIWSSTLFPGRAPDGCAALTTFVGGSRQPGLALRPETDLLKSVAQELGDLLGVHSNPVFSRVKVWESAIPQYTVGYGRILNQLGKFEERMPGLRFCANFRGGISVADCIQSADRTVSALQDYFSR
jgi:oxygen-dependent protoporphyrinogen oxidase